MRERGQKKPVRSTVPCLYRQHSLALGDTDQKRVVGYFE